MDIIGTIVWIRTVLRDAAAVSKLKDELTSTSTRLAMANATIAELRNKLHDREAVIKSMSEQTSSVWRARAVLQRLEPFRLRVSHFRNAVEKARFELGRVVPVQQRNIVEQTFSHLAEFADDMHRDVTEARL